MQGVDDEEWAVLDAGPDHEHYWDVWCDVEQGAVVLDDDGNRYTIWNDGDCWLIPEGMEFNEATETFEWPEQEEENGDQPESQIS